MPTLAEQVALSHLAWLRRRGSRLPSFVDARASWEGYSCR